MDKVFPFCSAVLNGRVERVHRARRIDQGRTRIDGDGRAQRLGDLFLGGAKFTGGLGMNRDTTVATQADRNRQRNQLSGLGVEVAGLFPAPERAA